MGKHDHRLCNQRRILRISYFLTDYNISIDCKPFANFSVDLWRTGAVYSGTDALQNEKTEGKLTMKDKKLTTYQMAVTAVMAAVLMPVCMAAPGDSVETRINNALAQRTGAELYQEIVTTAPDGTAQTMIAARSNGNAYIKMDMGDAGCLVYILKDGQGYLVDDASKMAVKGEVPTVSISEAVSADKGEAQEIPCTVTTVNVNGQDCEALSYTATDADGQTATVSYCLVGDDLKYVVTDAAEGRTIVEYRVTSTTVDQNLFNIPADYQILTQAEFEAAQANH